MHSGRGVEGWEKGRVPACGRENMTVALILIA